MIVDKYKREEATQETIPTVDEIKATGREEEVYSTNALCEVYKAVKKILGDLKADEANPTSPPLFHTIMVDNGQLRRIRGGHSNKEYGIAFPAVFVHFVNVRYLIQQSRIGEGRATMRIRYVLNRLNNSDPDYELEGYELFQRINSALQRRKGEFPALAARFQLTYFDQPESFDDSLQPFWIDYEVWFSEYSGYRYKDYVERYVVMPPFTDHSDQSKEVNLDKHGNHGTPSDLEAAGFSS
jgi:hypothetical protein